MSILFSAIAAPLLGLDWKIGVVVGITGFNYPLLLAAHKIAPAFAAGCPIIVKPAPQTPLATLWLVDLFRSALPPDQVASVFVARSAGKFGSLGNTKPRLSRCSNAATIRLMPQATKMLQLRAMLLAPPMPRTHRWPGWCSELVQRLQCD